MDARARLAARLRRWSRAALAADAAAALVAAAGAALCARAALLAAGEAVSGAGAAAQAVCGVAAALALLLERVDARGRLLARIDARHGCDGALLAVVEAGESRLADALAAQVEPRLETTRLWTCVAGAWPASFALALLGAVLCVAAGEQAAAGGGARPNSSIALANAALGLRDAAAEGGTARAALAEAAHLAEQVARALEQGDAPAAAGAREQLRSALGAAERAAESGAGASAAAAAATEARQLQAVAAARTAFGLSSAGAGAGAGGGGEARSGGSASGTGAAGLASRPADGTISAPRPAEAPPIAPAPPDLLPREDAEWIARWIARARGG